MNYIKMISLLLAALCLLAGCGTGTAEQTAAQTTTQPTQPSTTQATIQDVPPETQPVTQETTSQGLGLAPDFTVYDREGNAVKLSDFLGKPVVLNFWASWCQPCQNEMPAFEMLYDHYGDEVQFLMVNITDGQNETVSTAMELVESQGYTFPVYFDVSLDAAITYGITSIPATYFIDEEGGAVANHVGSMDYETLKAGMEMIWQIPEDVPAE